MSEPPSWVLKRDGRRVPFDADKISQALFAATETLGHPDAFLARELTDGVLHFLAVEKDDDTLTTTQIAEIVAKTVRELGQPALAEAFAAGPEVTAPESDILLLRAPRDVPPRILFAELLRDYSQQAIYSRQVLAAQQDGLLTLTGLDTPGELEACTVCLFESMADALEEMHGHVGSKVVLDGPEYDLLRRGATTSEIERWVYEVNLAARCLRLRAVVNLNSAEPPSWAGDLARGPLFAQQRAAPDEMARAALADELLTRFTATKSSTGSVQINWHIGERACRDEHLQTVARLAADGAALTFVFDRPRRPVLLAEGIDRQHTAVLLTVGLHLPRLAGQPGLQEDGTLFLQKLGSLTRLALSAAVQKREYLRRLERIRPSPLTTGFLLDRARLVIVPIGLDHIVRLIHGRGLTGGGAALEFGKQIVMRLRDVLKQDGRTTHLDACIDGGLALEQAHHIEETAAVAGLTPWDATATLKNQLRAASALHTVAERGCLVLFLNGNERTPDHVADCVRQVWENSEVASLHFHTGEIPFQLPAPSRLQ